jgi:hypothetical protein
MAKQIIYEVEVWVKEGHEDTIEYVIENELIKLKKLGFVQDFGVDRRNSEDDDD